MTHKLLRKFDTYKVPSPYCNTVQNGKLSNSMYCYSKVDINHQVAQQYKNTHLLFKTPVGVELQLWLLKAPMREEECLTE